MSPLLPPLLPPPVLLLAFLNTGWFPRNPAARSEVNIPALSATLSALSLASLSASWWYRVADVD
jgi:hypothetical protein